MLFSPPFTPEAPPESSDGQLLICPTLPHARYISHEILLSLWRIFRLHANYFLASTSSSATWRTWAGHARSLRKIHLSREFLYQGFQSSTHCLSCCAVTSVAHKPSFTNVWLKWSVLELLHCTKMHPTAEVIASWPAPNYVNPVTRGWALTVVNILFIILVFLVAGARFYTRLRITRSWGLDDWMIAISLVSRIGWKHNML